MSEYKIPRQLLVDSEYPDIIETDPLLVQSLNNNNYIKKFERLLHLEEIATVKQVNQYRIEGAILRSCGPYLSLEVAGLAEKRPSLVLGDAAIVTCPSVGRHTYEGPIHEVRRDSVLLKFDPRFHAVYSGELCDVRFIVNRGPFKRQHQAVETGFKRFGTEVLFPTSTKLAEPQIIMTEEDTSSALEQVATEKRCAPDAERREERVLSSSSHCSSSDEDGGLRTSPFLEPIYPRDFPVAPITNFKGLKFAFKYTPREANSQSRLPPYTPKKKKTTDDRRPTWFNQRLNAEQKRAVVRILGGVARPLPYIIYGPPGTGKTVTVIEAVLQIFSRKQGTRTNSVHRNSKKRITFADSRILVATPSNSSADLIVERLIRSPCKISPNGWDLVRLNAFQRSEDSIPEEILPFCSRNNEAADLGKALRHRIVVATASTAGSLLKLGKVKYSGLSEVTCHQGQIIPGLKKGPFTNVFLDEAGHLTEPEALVPISKVFRGRRSLLPLPQNLYF